MPEGGPKSGEFVWEVPKDEKEQLSEALKAASQELDAVLGEIEDVEKQFGESGPAREREMARRRLSERRAEAKRKIGEARDRLREFLDKKEKSKG